MDSPCVDRSPSSAAAAATTASGCSSRARAPPPHNAGVVFGWIVPRSTFGLLASSSDPFRLHIYPLRSGETANVVVVVDPARRRRPPSRRLSSARPQHRRFRSRSSGGGSEKRNKWFLCTLCDLMEGGDGEVGERPLAFQRTLNKISATNDGVCTRGEAVSSR